MKFKKLINESQFFQLEAAVEDAIADAESSGGESYAAYKRGGKPALLDFVMSKRKELGGRKKDWIYVIKYGIINSDDLDFGNDDDFLFNDGLDQVVKKYGLEETLTVIELKRELSKVD